MEAECRAAEALAQGVDDCTDAEYAGCISDDAEIREEARRLVLTEEYPTRAMCLGYVKEHMGSLSYPIFVDARPRYSEKGRFRHSGRMGRPLSGDDADRLLAVSMAMEKPGLVEPWEKDLARAYPASGKTAQVTFSREEATGSIRVNREKALDGLVTGMPFGFYDFAASDMEVYDFLEKFGCNPAFWLDEENGLRSEDVIEGGVQRENAVCKRRCLTGCMPLIKTPSVNNRRGACFYSPPVKRIGGFSFFSAGKCGRRKAGSGYSSP